MGLGRGVAVELHDFNFAVDANSLLAELLDFLVLRNRQTRAENFMRRTTKQIKSKTWELMIHVRPTCNSLVARESNQDPLCAPPCHLASASPPSANSSKMAQTCGGFIWRSRHSSVILLCWSQSFLTTDCSKS